MKTWDFLMLAGLFVGTISGCLLAYDTFFGQGARFQSGVAATRLDTLRKLRSYLQESINSLPSQYTQEEKQRMLAEEAEKWGPEEALLKDGAERILDTHENKVITFGSIGIVLLILAFLLQFGATLWMALDQAT